jgi:hypothetical protein
LALPKVPGVLRSRISVNGFCNRHIKAFEHPMCFFVSFLKVFEKWGAWGEENFSQKVLLPPIF